MEEGHHINFETYKLQQTPITRYYMNKREPKLGEKKEER